MVFEDLGLIPYQKAWQYQEEIFQARVNQKLSAQNTDLEADTVLLCEHPPVFTLGKNGKNHNLLIAEAQLSAMGIEYFATNRGGDITFHGYGQLVVYPILDLERLGLSLRQYIWMLEEVVIRLLADYQLIGERMAGASGVWLDAKRKICALGVKSSKMITMHGLALNINTDLSYFNYINPCGFTDKGVTSIANDLKQSVDFQEVKDKFKNVFKTLFKP
jgi:lipoyl(octanoyl) transferase